MTTVLIADDHPLFRRALAQTVREQVGNAVVLEAGTLDEAVASLRHPGDVDLVLLDLHMPGSRGLMGLAALRAEFPAVAMVMISAHDDPRTVARALECGAMGFIPKSASPEQLGEALAAVLDCRDYLPDGLRREIEALKRSGGDDDGVTRRLASLSPQQHRVLALVAEGRLNKQIADVLGIQERTVKAHLTVIFERLGVRNRTQAGVLLRSLELADPSRDAG
ncbi:response regulator [Pseudofulvimonas gallinarii]|jgi:DNA-binding NarL/FixJ family response regulator|uniref:LuxR family two component transcriptional regulator n=1 Tax=Pseudofulvimonas gallinarii TaxID=634155 RepID=A0A4S3KZ97_9GAMM|nr:response regulator transcription factor [Pseudofulvimonas gallinarii]TCS96369.1 LuxR family two component transcriptional regulator [Pseudofulvimonas gallinarii]THD14722.1 DNA-binding response regulator [Pseudofulvimonas gallinarii]